MFEILISKKVDKQIKNIPHTERQKIIAGISALAHNPYPYGCKKLTGSESYRFRVGNYRVIYSIENERLIVNILSAGNRKNIYD